MNPIVSLIYQLADQAQITNINKKDELQFYVPKYGINFSITSFTDNRVEIKFLLSGTHDMNDIAANGINFITDISEVKDFVTDFYRRKTERENRTVIEKVGKNVYEQWLKRDLSMLNNPHLPLDNNTIEIENNYYAPELYNIIIKNQKTNLKEIISFNANTEPKNKFAKIEIVGSHFQEHVNLDTSSATQKTTYSIHNLRIYIPACDLEDYSFLKQHCAVQTVIHQNNFIEHLRKVNQNPELDNLLLYIHLDDKVELKKENSNKKKI